MPPRAFPRWLLTIVPWALAPGGAVRIEDGPGASLHAVTWESPHVHPLELTPDGRRLLAVDTRGAALVVVDVTGEQPRVAQRIPVGLDPVSVRCRTSREAWVVNHVSDSVSVVDLERGLVRETLHTDDEPADVVFTAATAARGERAWVTCSQANTLLAFDPRELDAAPRRLPLDGEEPRALALAPDGRTVYVAFFESGNGTTILGGGLDPAIFRFPPNAVSFPRGPYGGRNPPPNDGERFAPPIAPDLPPPPEVGLVVRRDAAGHWLDDNGGDWTDFVSGPRASVSGRPVGWQLVDHELAALDVDTGAIRYAGGSMNLCMALDVDPRSGRPTLVGTDARNEVRFEPNLNGTFLRVLGAAFEPDAFGPAPVAPPVAPPPRTWDLNPHLSPTESWVPEDRRRLSIGDPRAITWSADGERAFVAGMGSSHVIVLDTEGRRVGRPIEVPEGPTGLVLDGARGRLYVLARFDASLVQVELGSRRVGPALVLGERLPEPLRLGRRLLYDTHLGSGTGALSCASCHADARTDRLAWDLGDPGGAMVFPEGQNLGAGISLPDKEFEPWHPMKGPLVTLTLQDVVGQEPLHWRGDRAGIHDFAGAYRTLMGRAEEPTTEQMQALEDYLATIHFPPNPYRELDNSLPRSVPLADLLEPGRFEPVGEPLPAGDARRGRALFEPPNLLSGNGLLACATCHTAPSGTGTDHWWNGERFTPLPASPTGERHHSLVVEGESSQVTMRVPQLRGLGEKAGFDLTRTRSLAGFGFTRNGSVDTLARLAEMPFFLPADRQDVADLVAYLLAFSGEREPSPRDDERFAPPGSPSRASHAAVGAQVTIRDGNESAPARLDRLAELLALAVAGDVDLVAHGGPSPRGSGWWLVGPDDLMAHPEGGRRPLMELIRSSAPGAAWTLTAVPAGDGPGAVRRALPPPCSERTPAPARPPFDRSDPH